MTLDQRMPTDVLETLRDVEWSHTPLGPMSEWPEALRAVARLTLRLETPACLFWGDEATLIYNRAWAGGLGGLHPRALGVGAAEVSADLHEACAEALHASEAGDTPRLGDALRPLLWRSLLDHPSSAVGCTPVPGEDGAPLGLMVQIGPVATAGGPSNRDAAAEDETCTAFMLRLSDTLRRLDSPDDILATGTGLLGRHLGADRVRCAEVDLAARQGRALCEYRRDGSRPPLQTLRFDDFGAALRTLQNGIPLVLDDLAEGSAAVNRTASEIRRHAAGEFHAQITIPILRADRLVAAVTARHTQAHRWSAAEIAATQEAAVRIWEAVERARAEEALRESEQRFRALVTATSYVVYRMSPDWRELRDLDGRGFPVEAPQPGTSWLEQYIHPADRDLLWSAIGEAIATKSIFQIEHRVKRPDGTSGWAFSRAVPLLDEAGEITEWFGAASDVTDRRQATEAVRQAELRLRLAQEAAGVATFDWLIESNEGRWSPEMVEMLGLKPGALGGSYEEWISMIHPDDLSEATRCIDAAFDNGLLEGEWRVVRPDGETLWVLVRGVLERDARNRRRRLTGAQVDITERAYSMQRLSLLIEDMDAKIAAFRRQIGSRGK